MVYQTDPNIQRAREHIESGNRERLSYACLELRYALERIAYQKLQLRLDKITIEEIAAWQPQRAMDRLMELVDEHLERDATISMAPEDEQGKTLQDEFVTLGQTKGISPRELGKHWQKLSSYLHIRMPKKKGEMSRPPDDTTLRPYLKEVVDYVEEITKTRFDFHFASNVTFECGKCGQKIVRNKSLLKEKTIVQCQNPNCDDSYITHIIDGEFEFESYQISLDCRNCGETTYIDANVFRNMKTDEGRVLVCDNCEARHLVRWLLKYGLEAETQDQKN